MSSFAISRGTLRACSLCIHTRLQLNGVRPYNFFRHIFIAFFSRTYIPIAVQTMFVLFCSCCVSIVFPLLDYRITSHFVFSSSPLLLLCSISRSTLFYLHLFRVEHFTLSGVFLNRKLTVSVSVCALCCVFANVLFSILRFSFYRLKSLEWRVSINFCHVFVLQISFFLIWLLRKKYKQKQFKQHPIGTDLFRWLNSIETLRFKAFAVFSGVFVCVVLLAARTQSRLLTSSRAKFENSTELNRPTIWNF